MPEDKSSLQKGMWLLKEFWFIALMIASIITGWTSINNEIKYQEARISALEIRSKAVDTILTQISSDVSFIRGRLEK